MDEAGNSLGSAEVSSSLARKRVTKQQKVETTEKLKVTAETLSSWHAKVNEKNWQKALSDAQEGAKQGLHGAAPLFCTLFQKGKGILDGLLLASDLIYSDEVGLKLIARSIINSALEQGAGANLVFALAVELIAKTSLSEKKEGLLLLTELARRDMGQDELFTLGESIESRDQSICLAQLDLFIELVSQKKIQAYPFSLKLAQKSVKARDLTIRAKGFVLARALVRNGYALQEAETMALSVCKSALWQDLSKGLDLLGEVVTNGGRVNESALAFAREGVNHSSPQVKEEAIGLFYTFIQKEVSFKEGDLIAEGIKAAEEGMKGKKTASLSIDLFTQIVKEGAGSKEAEAAIDLFKKNFPWETAKLKKLEEELAALKPGV